MSFRKLILGVVALVLLPAVGSAQGAFPRTYQRALSGELPLRGHGIVIIDNPQGDVYVEGVDGETIQYRVLQTMRGVDDEAIRDARGKLKAAISGDSRVRMFRSLGSASGQTPRWAATTTWHLRVPRTAEVRIATINSRSIEVKNLAAPVKIKNQFHGKIRVISPGSPILIETINGHIGVIYTGRPAGDARLTSVNGNIEVIVPRHTNVHWYAETLKGKVLATPSIHGRNRTVEGTRIFEARQGASEGPTLHLSSTTGTMTLIESGLSRSAVRAVVPELTTVEQEPLREDLGDELQRVSALLVRPPAAREFVFQRKRMMGDLQFATDLGSIFVGEIAGSARLSTSAGEIVVGRVQGNFHARSSGGPLNLGYIRGPLDASTVAGDVTVAAAMQGGRLHTGGGNIQVLRSAGPLTLHSGGGDITVRQALSSIAARTKSGDVSITVGPGTRGSRIDAETVGGNVIITLPSDFGALVDAVIVVTEPEASYAIESQLPGLTIVREQVGSRIHIRARGPLQGGGQPVFIRVQDGNIQIRKP